MTLKIKKENQPAALAALYNNSKQQGMGFFDPRGTQSLTEDEAKELLKEGEPTYFDYLAGRVMKLDFSKEEISVGLYDRDNGEGAAKFALELREVPFEVV